MLLAYDALSAHLVDLAGWSEAVMAFARGGGYQLRSGFSRLEMDTLIIWGLNDNFVNPKGAPNYQENIKHCQIVWLEQCGHCASVERPEEVANLLLKFLKSGLPVQTV